MRNYLIIFVFSFFSIISVSAFSAAIPKESIPREILDNLLTKHPDATDITAIKTKHFGVELFEISFKQPVKPVEGEEAVQTKEKLIELYHTSGKFYVNGTEINTSKNSTEMPVATYDNLKAAFPDYSLKEAIMVVNPNGAGEEYDLLIGAADGLWRVTINRKGEIVSKERD
jgi:hypothetical protein